MTTETHLTETDLAERWQISLSSIQKYRGKGQGPAFLIIGPATVRYRMEDVLAYEEARATGGYVAPRAKKVMLRAAGFFDKIGAWKMADETRAHLAAISAELRDIAHDPATAKKTS